MDVAAGSTLFEVQVNATDELSVPLPAAVVGVLAQSATYRAVVVATSNAGLTGVAEASFVVDNTPPDLMLVHDGTGSNDLTCSSVSLILG